MQKDWYTVHKTWRAMILAPLSWLFSYIAKKRKVKLQKKAYQSKLPLIVVGNIAVGGTGKTPVVQAICQHLKEQGYHPAIITRGYGGKATHYPFMIDERTPASICGDEPFMLHQLLPDTPIVISPKRVEAIQYIEEKLKAVDIIISDDGLQHYAMHRNVEIAVIDGQRQFGNGLCLPAGPLREPITRLEEVDMMVINGGGRASVSNKAQYDMQLLPQSLVSLATGQQFAIDQLLKSVGSTCYAVAGIGNPKRFFNTLKNLGFMVEEYPFKDHHSFTLDDFKAMNDNMPMIMTYKDAVKCQGFAKDNWYYLAISPEIEKGFFEILDEKLSLLERGKEGGKL
ncbi:tetraacyldisaccharide 4'-kinase [Cysteiniphilum litorale]|uniref:Tetraacyldisaccharide 4'-kinase n=1 Tax=Cysteiniphilum litorale TaxID=2056700 RepID=A0A8J2Z5W0_9GAMM|nr:tetraacyldisaccharide 4'-kinase [Cysteiniphilum litorale]